MSDEQVTISRAKFHQLEKDSDLLACLENAGVDNWDGYGDALRNHNEAYGEDDD